MIASGLRRHIEQQFNAAIVDESVG